MGHSITRTLRSNWSTNGRVGAFCRADILFAWLTRRRQRNLCERLDWCVTCILPSMDRNLNCFIYENLRQFKFSFELNRLWMRFGKLVQIGSSGNGCWRFAIQWNDSLFDVRTSNVLYVIRHARGELRTKALGVRSGPLSMSGTIINGKDLN